MKMLKFVLMLVLSLGAPLLAAQETAPDTLLQSVTAEVIAALKQERDAGSRSSTQVASIVETKVLPLFDFAHMTQIAVARNWRVATAEQKTALITEFKTLLVRTYSAALTNYRDNAIEYRRLVLAPGGTEVTVKSVVKQRGHEAITIDYDMEKTAAGWKVYDITVAGVSLITTYRDGFSEKIRDSGVDGLIKQLADKNQQRDAQPRGKG